MSLTASCSGYPVFNYTKMTFAHPKGLVSPRYWLLWGGIFLMMTCSFAEIFCNGKSIYTVSLLPSLPLSSSTRD